MIYSVINESIDLARGVQLTHIKPTLVTEDSKAHRFVISVSKDGSAVDMAGATITGSFVRADGITVKIDGEAVQNTAIVTLSAECYREEGRCLLAVKATMGDVISTLYLADGNVTRSATDAFIADEETALSLEELFRRLDAGVSSVEASASIAAQAAQDAQVALGGADAVQRAEEAAEAVEDALERLQNVDASTLVAELDALRTAVTPATLWAGDWASGSIEVQNIGKWRLLDIQTGLGHVLGVNDGTSIRAFGVLGAGGNHITVNLSMTVAGEDVTLAINSRYTHPASGSHGSDNTTTIKAITGLVMMEGAA